jgi:hypothetical protein
MFFFLLDEQGSLGYEERSRHPNGPRGRLLTVQVTDAQRSLLPGIAEARPSTLRARAGVSRSSVCALGEVDGIAQGGLSRRVSVPRR